ncbi:MAG: hypothetical protein WD737_09210 [Gemmatimonadota bacterium]
MTEPQTPPDRPERGARLTPYELVFTEGEFESRIFPRIGEEAAEQKVDTLQPELFDFLTTAADVVRQVTPEDAPPEALDQYRSLLYHAYNFWKSGKRLYVVEPATARYLVEAAPALSDWSFTMSSDAAYLQLPANLFWSSVSPDTPPEPVDGFFVTVSEGSDALEKSFESLEILVILGIRRSRAGFSVIPVSTGLGDEVAEAWDAEERPEGDFANALPGGEIAGLYSMLTTSEVLKLVGRILWYVDSFPAALVDVAAVEPRDEEDEAPLSHLAHRRVTLQHDEQPDDSGHVADEGSEGS